MYTDSMKTDELVDEFKNDLAQVISISNTKQTKADRIIKRAAAFPVYLHSFVKSKRGNQWIILFEAKSKKYIGNNCLMTLVSLRESGHGRYAIMYSSAMGRPQYMIFTPHFFHRFSLRAGIDLTGKELIRRYFERNPSYGLTYKNEDGISNVYGSTTEGVALGVRPECRNNVILFKTFISYEMCKGQQVEEFAKSDEFRKEMHEEEISLQRAKIPE